MNHQHTWSPVWSQSYRLCLLFFMLAACLLSTPSSVAQTSGFTLDFEEGTLRGWQRRGNAFDGQPTKGDNPTARQRGQPSKHQGEFWIGTYERYQGKRGQRPGAIQGDAPTGTLSTPTFTLPDGTLSFLVGGGSDFSTRVELVIVKGQGEFNETRVLHASGRNTETMHRVTWDLSPYAGQQARLHIVDGSSGGWGHINADDFRFTPSRPAAAQPPIADRMKGLVAVIPQQTRSVVVPSLIGHTFDEAHDILQRHQLLVGDINERPSSRPARTVVAQEPAAQTQVRENSRVDLWLATPQDIRVPQLVDRSVDEAIAILSESGLEAGDLRKERSARKEGTVIRQEPAAETPVRRGAAIDLWVAIADLVEVPHLIGDQFEEATQTLRRHRLALGSLSTSPSEKPADTVLDQRPRGGDRVPAGSGVDLWLAEQIQVTVPDLGGLIRAEAEAEIRTSRLVMGGTREKDSTQQPGTVIDQKPRAGSRVPVRSTVDLLLAKLELVAVPDLTGLSLAETEKAISRARLKLGDQEKRPSEKRPGTVLEQRPTAGDRVPVGSRVVIWTATPELVEVPDLIGLSRHMAERTLADSRLRLGEGRERASDQAAGTVLAQQPGAGTRVPVGSAINLVLAAAIAERWVTVPSLTGMTPDQARTALASVGLLLGRLEERPSASVAGSVVDQAPAPGSEMTPNSQVNIVVAVAVVTPAIPMWAWLAGGFLGVGAASVTIARLCIRKSRSSVARKDLTPRIEPHPDAGRQHFEGKAPSLCGPALRLRPIPDPGKTSIVPPEPTVLHEENDHDQ
jgi:beta-lactam-binding protein with PASTA domain